MNIYCIILCDFCFVSSDEVELCTEFCRTTKTGTLFERSRNRLSNCASICSDSGILDKRTYDVPGFSLYYHNVIARRT